MMVAGVVENVVESVEYPELAGARVLITGLEARHGVDIARAFAECHCRLILQTPDADRELDIVLEVLARDAQEIRVTEEPMRDAAAALKLAHMSGGAYGCLAAVINLAHLDDTGLGSTAGPDEIEDRLAVTLGRPLRITQVIANRMQMTWREGLILNVVTQRTPQTPAAAQLGQIARAALAALTRREAERRAGQAVRADAIVPAAEERCEAGAVRAQR